MKKILKPVVFLIILAFAAGTVFFLYANKPKSKKRKKQKRQVPIVQVIPLVPTDETVVIDAYGTVIPAKKITLKPEVEGKIIEMHPDLVPGGIIPKNSVLVRIDPSDYQFLVSERQADVAEARYKLELEQGQQVIAKKEWQILEKEGAAPDNASQSLALRKPHLQYARARLQAAESRLAAAKMDLERTAVTAPFNALVLEESIEQGQIVSRNAPVATLVATKRFWIQVSLPADRLGRLRFPGASHTNGSSVTITSQDGASRTGQVLRLLGDLDPKGRMARILVAIDDPLGLSGRTEKILLGSYVQVAINAGTLKNTYVIPREAMRENDTVWLVDTENRLVMQNVHVRWRRQKDVLVSLDAPTSAQLVTSRLQSPLPGMLLKPAQVQ